MQPLTRIFIATLVLTLAGSCGKNAKQAPPPEVADRSNDRATAAPEVAAEPAPAPESAVPDAGADELAHGELRIPALCRNGGNGHVELTNVNFEFNAHTLTEATRATLDAHAECLQALPGLQLVVEGHCDERGTQEFNLALGNDRAHAVRRYLANLGVPTGRLRPVSKGKNQPLCDESTDACWARNRRVRFVVVAGGES